MFQYVSDIAKDYQAGKLPRDEYWTRMQQSHFGLADYCQLIQSNDCLERIEIKPEGLDVVLKNGLRMIWNPHDIRTAPNVLVNHGGYESQELVMVEYLARFCSVVFDIGANVGWYSLHFARLVPADGGKVYAFEPVPQTFSTLERNIKRNGLQDIILPFQLALGESETTSELYVPSFSGSVAASQHPLFPGEENTTVKCVMTSLDAFVTQQSIRRLDLIKCDVEGGELFVLRGGLKTIEKHKPILMLEMLRKWARQFDYQPNDIITLLNELGYRCWSCEDHRFVEVTVIGEECAQTNFFFLHSPKHDAVLAAIGQQSV